MNVTELTTQDCAAWDDYVRNSPDGLPHHLTAWRTILAESYGYRTQYLLARNNLDAGSSPIVGVMPLFLVSSLLTGRTVMTMPGGLCADDERAAAALIDHATAIARQCRADRLVIQDGRCSWSGPFQSSTEHVAWIVDVAGSEEALSQRIHRNIRRQVRMAESNGLHVIVDRTERSLHDFYHVLSRFTHQSGTPVFGRTFLANTAAHLAGQYNIVTIYAEHEPIGSYFQLEMGDTIYGLWGASLHDYLPLRPVYLAYWEILHDANRRGFSTVDMGRSPVDSTASAFKRQWGGNSLPIHQQTLSLGAAPQASMTERTRRDGRLRSFMQLWPKIPFPVAQFLGPKLRRHVPFA